MNYATKSLASEGTLKWGKGLSKKDVLSQGEGNLHMRTP